MLSLAAASTAISCDPARRILVRRFIVACIITSLLCCPEDLFAQASTDRIVLRRNVLWMTANTVIQANNRWALLADLSHRRSDFARENDLTLVRVAPAYWINPNLSVAVGYAHLWSTTSGSAGEITLNENRLHQQLIYILRRGRGSFNTRLRIEERWREASINASPSSTFNYTTRYRLMLGYRFPLSRAALAPQVVLAEEIMLHTGKAVQYGHFEQNRLFAGIQWRFSKALNLETGYMYTWQKLLPENTYQSIHTLRLTLTYERFAGKERQTVPADIGSHK